MKKETTNGPKTKKKKPRKTKDMGGMLKYDLKAGLDENFVGRKRMETNRRAAPIPSHRFADRTNRLETIIPVIKVSEIHSNSIAGIVH